MSQQSKFEYLQDLIKKTRLAHINAERRLLALDALTRHASLYFACWTLTLTLLTLFFKSTALTLLSVIAAAITTLCTLYASSQGYGIRAAQMKQSYLDLQGLLFEFDNAERRGETDEQKATFADEAGERYVSILSQTENHTSVDYENSVNQSRENLMNSLVRYLLCRFCIYVVPVIVGILVVMLLPE
ncbi:MAG: SLATT domain-containing protein [Olsenella sp.]|nr:SLATT domain-containing protein [Olsenella sp.]